jgi:hypothetical protein
MLNYHRVSLFANKCLVVLAFGVIAVWLGVSITSWQYKTALRASSAAWNKFWKLEGSFYHRYPHPHHIRLLYFKSAHKQYIMSRNITITSQFWCSIWLTLPYVHTQCLSHTKLRLPQRYAKSMFKIALHNSLNSPFWSFATYSRKTLPEKS